MSDHLDCAAATAGSGRAETTLDLRIGELANGACADSFKGD